MENGQIKNEDNAQSLLTQIVTEYYKDKKRSRFVRRIKRIILFLAIVAVIFMYGYQYMDEASSKFKPHVGLIDIKGEIIGSQISSSDVFMKSLSSAYDSKGLKALIFRIDSPGGSPVQADYMFNAVRYFKQKYPDIKTYAVCVDTCASAAYYVASAADEIYASPASVVGSIGVIYNGFGFVDTMNKLGISRRLMTSGDNKGFMDQFSPVNPAHEKDLKVMLDLIHDQFIKQVQLGRGSRLKTTPEIFSGLIWTGVQAKELGLIDGFASSGQLMRDTIKIESVVDYTEKHSMLEQFADKLGASILSNLPEALGMRSGLQ